MYTTAESIEEYARDYYDCSIEFPWENHPTFAVLRHKYGRSWFGLVMILSEHTLGISDKETLIPVLNVKANPFDVEFLKTQPGFAPAYHMNKTHWISIILNGTVSDKQIEEMLAESYRLTEK